MVQFTIIVPTRNRPDSLRVTLLGLAELTHPALSICISDNSDSEFFEANKNLAKMLLKNKNYKYIRPGETMTMSDHWEFAIDNAGNSDFYGIITDRMTLTANTIKICENALKYAALEAICFNSGNVSGASGTELNPLPNPILAKQIFSLDALNDFSKSQLRKDTPRFLNSFVSSSILNRIRKKYGKLFHGISPDYAFAFRFLDVCESFLYINAPLLVDHSPNISNGMAMTRNITNKATSDFLMRLYSQQISELAVGPLPFETTLLPNVILRELEIAKIAAKQPHQLPQIEAERFLISCSQASRRFARFFDPHTLQVNKLIHDYRISHGLPPLPLSVRRTTLAKTLRNTMFYWMSLFRGDSMKLPGISRDAAGELTLQKNLRKETDTRVKISF